jgi:Tol biopolymer transport system component
VGRQLAPTSETGVLHMTIPPPPGREIRHAGDLAGPVAVSPDGSTVAFAAAAPNEPQRLWVRRLDEPDPREIPGTDGAMFPFWSPDSRSVAFFARTKLRRVELASETVMAVCDVNEARGGAWAPDGRIIFSPMFRGPLSVVADTGGTPEPLTTLDETKHTTHRWPSVLPDGRHFLFFAGQRDPTGRQDQGIYLGTLDGASAPRRLTQCNVSGMYANGWLLFVRDEVLLASRVDLDGARLTGKLRVLARDVAVDQSTWHGQFSVGGETLAFNRRMMAAANAPDDRGDEPAGGFEGDILINFDRTGRPLQQIAEGIPMTQVTVSPDGFNLVLAVPSRGGTPDLWLYPTSFNTNPDDPVARARVAEIVMNPNPRRLTFLEGSESRVAWSPDSTEIVFARHDGPEGTAGIYRKHIEGGAEQLVLPATDAAVYPDDWTRDGKYLVYVRGNWQPSEADDIWALPLDGGEPIPLVQTPVGDWMARVSPDGKWLSYVSRQSGLPEVYVVPFAPAWPEEARSRRWQVSLNGGREPIWSADGTELFYISDTGMLMAVPVLATEQTFEFGRPEALFQTPYDTGMTYGVMPPGDVWQFVFMDNRESPNKPISVIHDWQQLLQDAAP